MRVNSISHQQSKYLVNNIRFSPCGGYIGITIQKFNPLLYSVEGGPEPVAVLEGDGFSSLATIKTGEFCTTLGQTLFMAGGDDGGVYGWKIPECHGGLDGSRIPSNQRLKNDMFFINDEGGFVQPNVIKESLRLAGSSAIINSVSCHPSLPYLVTAGVEKVVRIYSPHKIPVLDGKTKGENRDIRTEPDEDTLEFFKMLVRREQIGVEQYLWRRFRFDVVSVTDEDSERIDSDEDDSTSDDSWSEYGVELMPQDYDNDSNISAE